MCDSVRPPARTPTAGCVANFLITLLGDERGPRAAGTINVQTSQACVCLWVLAPASGFAWHRRMTDTETDPHTDMRKG